MHLLAQSEEMKCCQIILLLKSIGILVIGFNGSIIRFYAHTLSWQCGFLCLFHSRFPLSYGEVSLLQGALSLSSVLATSPLKYLCHSLEKAEWAQITQITNPETQLLITSRESPAQHPAVRWALISCVPCPFPPPQGPAPHAQPPFPSAAQLGFARPDAGMINSNIVSSNQI